MRILRTALTLGLVLAFAASARADVSITVVPSVAPNAYGSPSFDSWASNAMYALENNLSSYGTPGTPAYYSATPAVLPLADNIVTGFSSWDGVANPGGAFAGELGNRITFGFVILGNGTQISASELSQTMSSSDPSNTLGWTWTAGSFSYDDHLVGIIHPGDPGYVGNGIANDIITSGDGTQLVDELVSIGGGNAWDVYTNSGGGSTLQEKLDSVTTGTAWYDTDNGASGPGTPYALGPNVLFTGAYTLGSASGSASVDLVAVPEPISMIFFGTGLVAVGGFVARRKMQKA